MYMYMYIPRSRQLVLLLNIVSTMPNEDRIYNDMKYSINYQLYMYMYCTRTIHVLYMYIYSTCTVYVTVHVQYMYCTCTVHVLYMCNICTVHV